MNTNELATAVGLSGKPVTAVTANGVTTLKVSGEVDVPIVLTCELWALRCICTRRGLDSAITSGIAALGEQARQVATARWTYGGAPIKRTEWLIDRLRVWIGYTHRQMDKLFEAAAELMAE